MASVTQRIKTIKQPKDGYINPKAFKSIQLKTNDELFSNENISPTTIGIVVDYLTRFCLNKNKLEAFKISLLGAKIAETEFQVRGSINKANELLKHITGNNDKSIINACDLVGYDVYYRNATWVLTSSYSEYKERKIPDKQTINNIKILINRSLKFFEEFGPITTDGFTFESSDNKLGGYTETIDTGDGDFLTKDTLWDFKVSKNKLNKNQTLQLAIYYIMGKHSKKEIFNNITKVGIFNPRLNIIYLLDMNNVSKTIINAIEKNVICYK